MPRPRKGATDKRSKGVTVWLTPDDHATLSARAGSAGLSLSAFLARTAARRTPPGPGSSTRPSVDTAVPFALADELRRIGVNLNQLTRLAHVAAEHQPTLTHLLGEIGRILDRVHGDAERRSISPPPAG